VSTKLAVLLSGSGTTLENLFVRQEAGTLDISVEIVIGTKTDAYGLERARQRSVATEVVIPKSFDSTEAFSDKLTAVIDEYDVDLVVMAGFMFLYKVPEHLENKVLNIHPALIPAFCGKGYYGHHVHEAVLERGTRVTGCTVHFVDNIYDNGPIVLQKVVDVKDDDTPDTLAERVQAAEREAYPEAIALIGSGTITINGRRVIRTAE